MFDIMKLEILFPLNCESQKFLLNIFLSVYIDFTAKYEINGAIW